MIRFYILLFAIFCLLNEGRTVLIWKQIATTQNYDVINDYVNHLFYFVTNEKDQLYQSIYYQDADVIVKQKLDLGLNNIQKIKTSYNQLTYADDPFYYSAILTVSTPDMLYVYISDNFGYNRNSSLYHWQLVKTIPIDNYDIGYGLNNSWIICYTILSNITCEVTYDGFSWKNTFTSYPHNNCNNPKIISGPQWTIYCFDGSSYQSATYLADGNFSIGFGIGDVSDPASFKSATLPDGKVLIVVGNTTYYSTNLVNELLLTKDYTADLQFFDRWITDVVIFPEHDKFQLAIRGYVTTTTNGAAYESPSPNLIQYVITKRNITHILNNYFGKAFPISYEDNELYIAPTTILVVKMPWPYLLPLSAVEPEYNFDQEITLTGDIKLDLNETIVSGTKLEINGNLTLNTNLVLNQTQTIIISDTFNIGGNLTVYLDGNQTNTTLFVFSQSNGQKFDNVTFKNGHCQEYLEYKPTSINVLFDTTKRCNEDHSHLKKDFILSDDFLIIVVGVGIAIVIIIVGLSLFVFSNKIFPHRGRDYYFSDEPQ